MKVEKIDLYEYFKIKKPQGAQAFLTLYLQDGYKVYPKRTRPAMLVVAGGGYWSVSLREKEPVAIKFLEKGYNAFVLDYSVEPVCFPNQLIEGAMAMAYIRKNAKALGVDKNHVGAVGFSAGGHLTGMLATMFDAPEVVGALKSNAKYVRPDAVILSYPVIKYPGKTNIKTFINISGGNEQLMRELSLEKKVTENSSPAFIWTTVADTTVPMESSIAMMLAYREKEVPFEFHAFTNGGHGLSICDQETSKVNNEAKEWLNLAFNWLKVQGFKIKDKN